MKRLFLTLILGLSVLFSHPVFAKGGFSGGARVSSFSSRPAMTSSSSNASDCNKDKKDCK